MCAPEQALGITGQFPALTAVYSKKYTKSSVSSPSTHPHLCHTTATKHPLENKILTMCHKEEQ